MPEDLLALLLAALNAVAPGFARLSAAEAGEAIVRLTPAQWSLTREVLARMLREDAGRPPGP